MHGHFNRGAGIVLDLDILESGNEIDILQRLFGSHFPKWSDADWLGFARRTFKEADGRVAADYDARLATTLAGLTADRPLPPLWKEFDALARLPVMVVRGSNSDILSPTTVAAMRERRRCGTDPQCHEHDRPCHVELHGCASCADTRNRGTRPGAGAGTVGPLRTATASESISDIAP